MVEFHASGVSVLTGEVPEVESLAFQKLVIFPVESKRKLQFETGAELVFFRVN